MYPNIGIQYKLSQIQMVGCKVTSFSANKYMYITSQVLYLTMCNINSSPVLFTKVCFLVFNLWSIYQKYTLPLRGIHPQLYIKIDVHYCFRKWDLINVY